MCINIFSMNLRRAYTSISKLVNILQQFVDQRGVRRCDHRVLDKTALGIFLKGKIWLRERGRLYTHICSNTFLAI